MKQTNTHAVLPQMHRGQVRFHKPLLGMPA